MNTGLTTPNSYIGTPRPNPRDAGPPVLITRFNSSAFKKKEHHTSHA